MIGDHFYTMSAPERDNAIRQYGYQTEGVACYVFSTASLNLVPLHRLLQTQIGDHFYTTSDAERDNAVQQNQYRTEGGACYVHSAQAPNTVPLYRLLNAQNGDHFYTASAVERDNAVGQYGYQNEGTACFVLPAQVGGSVPLFRLLKTTDPVPPSMPQPPRKAQLTFTNTWLQPTTFPRSSQPFSVQFSFANVGQIATGPFTIRLVFTDRGTLTSTQFDIAAPSFSPGAQDYAYWPFPNGLPQGSYVIDAYLDVFNQVAEDFEGLEPHYSSNGFVVG